MNKTILITGASTGIGAETARTLAPDAVIFVHYWSSRAAAEKVASDVQARQGKAHLVQADLSTEEGCAKLFAELKARTDKLDVLFNNAGGLIERRPATDLGWDLMLRTFTLNAFSAIRVSSLCIPLLRKGTDPCIINNSSIACRHGAPGAVIYGAAKGAVDSFTRGLAKELAPDIRVNAVAPGVIDTPFHEEVSTPERMRAFAESAPLKRNGQAHHIAMAVLLLIENDFMTGETIDVNGGLHMH